MPSTHRTNRWQNTKGLALLLLAAGFLLASAGPIPASVAKLAPYAQAKENVDRQDAHAGGSVGGTSQLIVYPDSHVVVALVTNLSGVTWKMEEVTAVAEAFEAIKK